MINILLIIVMIGLVTSATHYSIMMNKLKYIDGLHDRGFKVNINDGD